MKFGEVWDSRFGPVLILRELPRLGGRPMVEVVMLHSNYTLLSRLGKLWVAELTNRLPD